MYLRIAILTIVLSSCASRHKLISRSEYGQKADVIARQVYLATNKPDSCDSLLPIQWQLGKRKSLWDRKRNYYLVVREGEKMILNLAEPAKGKAYKNGELLSGKAKTKALETAYHWWANDSYWFNPFAKFFDDGVNRATYTDKKGNQHLIIYYKNEKGKAADTFDWTIGNDNLPDAWNLWVKVIPIFKNYKVSWEDWQKTSCGHQYSQLHKSTFFKVHISNVKTISDWSASEFKTDPFSVLTE